MRNGDRIQKQERELSTPPDTHVQRNTPDEEVSHLLALPDKDVERVAV